MLTKLREQGKKIRDQESQIFFLRSSKLRQKLRIRCVKEKLEEYSKRGNMKSVCHLLSQADEKNLFKDKTVLKDYLNTIARNLHASRKGRRYMTSTKQFYQVLLMLGGPKVANFVALNMCGPEIHTIYRWRKESAIDMKLGIHHENFKILAETYNQFLVKCGIKGPVPVLLAEDETAIINKVDYNEKLDTLEGFCGIKGEQHQCLDEFVVQVGNGEDGYNNITTAFRDLKIANYARAIIVNPLLPNVPKLTLLVMPTCNRFDHKFVYHQWQKTTNLYQEHLESALGPVIGHSSDGDQRRRKLMLQLSTCSEGDRLQPVPREEGFYLTCRKENQEEGGYIIRELADQDYVHNLKKLVNPLDHASRQIRMGPFLVHICHIEKVYVRFSHDEHGLRLADVQRQDRQNFQSAQRLVFVQVQNCLQRILEGTEDMRADPGVKGTLVYLQVIHMYGNIFCGTTSLYDRLLDASTVAHFLAIWHNFIKSTPGLRQDANFISRQSYIDVELSCHMVFTLVCYMRDNFPSMKCHLELT